MTPLAPYLHFYNIYHVLHVKLRRGYVNFVGNSVLVTQIDPLIHCSFSTVDLSYSSSTYKRYYQRCVQVIFSFNILFKLNEGQRKSDEKREMR
jgi:hypothetical protein